LSLFLFFLISVAKQKSAERQIMNILFWKDKSKILFVYCSFFSFSAFFFLLFYYTVVVMRIYACWHTLTLLTLQQKWISFSFFFSMFTVIELLHRGKSNSKFSKFLAKDIIVIWAKHLMCPNDWLYYGFWDIKEHNTDFSKD